MKAYGYCRVSTSEQAVKGVSLEAQAQSIQEWASNTGNKLIRVFEDAGISGTKLRQRPALQEALVKTCSDHAILVVYSLSRLSRSTKDTLHIAEKLDRAGADLISLSEQIDTTSASGKMIFRLLAILAEFEADQISERTSAALQHKKAKGLVYSPVPFGYRREGNRLIPVALEQNILESMLSMKSEGRSYRWIAEYLTEQGIPTKNGGKWYPGTIRRMLMRWEGG